MNNITNIILNSGILATLLGLLGSAITLGKKALDAKAAQLEAQVKDANIRNALTTAESTISAVVGETAQTTVDAIKSVSADGKLTPDDAQKIKDAAASKIRQLMSDNVYASLHSVIADVDAWIESKIEAAVKELKLKSPAAAAVIGTIQTSVTTPESNTESTPDAAPKTAEAADTVSAAAAEASPAVAQ